MEPNIDPIQSSSINNPVGFPGTVPQAPAPQKSNWKWLLILVLFLLVIGGVTFFVFKSSRSNVTEASPSPEATDLSNVSTPEPTPSSTPANKSGIKIQVLNGTGIAGEAGLLSDQLKNLGYTDVTPGNATDQSNTDTKVTFGSSVPSDVSAEITGKLKELYTNVTSGSSTLNGFDVQVITGLRKGQTSAPAATNSPTPTATPAQ